MANPIPVPAPTEKEAARFWAKVDKQENGCWIWTGAKFTQGYGMARLRGKNRRAHRVAYVWAYGELDASFSGLDHICDNKLCVNPEHLRPASTLENTLRSEVGPTAANARKTHCINGHLLDYHDSRGWRGCKICRREAVARYVDRNRERINAERRKKRHA